MNSWMQTVYGNRTGEVIDFISPPSPTDICNSTPRLCAHNPIRDSSPPSIKSPSKRTDWIFSLSDPVLNVIHLGTSLAYGIINTSLNLHLPPPYVLPSSSTSKSYNGCLYLLPKLSFSKCTAPKYNHSLGRPTEVWHVYTTSIPSLYDWSIPSPLTRQYLKMLPSLYD